MQRVTQWLARHPLIVIVVVAVLTFAALLSCLDPVTRRPAIAVDASIDNLLPPSSEDRAVFDRSRLLFGDTEAILVAVTLDPVFSVENLRKVAALSERFRELPGVDRVFSLATAPNLVASGGDIDARTFTQQATDEPQRIAEFRAQLDANPVYRGTLVSKDGRATAFAISLSGVSETMLLESGYPDRIRAIVREVAGDAEVWITGGPVVKTATTRALLDTLGFTIPLIFGLMAVVLLLAFRSLRAVLVCLVTVAIALLWTVATVSLLGLTLNLVTAIVPPMVLTLGLTYTIHVLSDYLKHEPGSPAGRSAADRAVATMSHIAVPIGLSFVTTVIGFL
ncbi:MAG: MMPL family transporter, partial [Nevskiaceae bacterium]